MIPSPTKLALFTGIVLLTGREGGASPARYDQRQEGELNFRADVEDVVLVAVTPKDSVANGMTWLGSHFIRQGLPNRIPTRTASKHGFVATEKSPYKVDLGKSTVPLVKLRSPVVEEIKLYKIRDGAEEGAVEGDRSEILVSLPESSATEATESKTVKKNLKSEETGSEANETGKYGATTVRDVEKEKKAMPKGTSAEEEKKKVTSASEEKSDEDGSSLVVIGDNLDPTSNIRHEGCGPKAHRDSSGKCVYE